MSKATPARLLLNILTAGKSYKPNSDCKVVWSKLLKIKENDLGLLLSRVGKAMKLPEQTLGLVKKYYPDQVSTHAHWYDNVKNAFLNQNLSGNWQSFISYIDDHTIQYLIMTTSLLDNKIDNRMLSDEQLKDIWDKINDIISEILEMDDLNQNIKQYIVSNLRKILNAIEEYIITGAEPIIEPIKSILGHIFFDESYKRTLETEIGKKLLQTLHTVSSIVTVSTGLPQLLLPILE